MPAGQSLRTPAGFVPVVVLLLASSPAVPARAQFGAVRPDVTTIDGLMHAVYGLLSGGIAEARDWDGIRGLYYPGARMTHTSGLPGQGAPVIQSGTVEDWIAAVRGYVTTVGFHETEIARRVDEYGTIAHVFSTYEYRADDGSMRGRGINSFQLYFDGERYWIMSVIWSAETDASPIPPQYGGSRQ